jgi:hypothetical protein
MAMNAYDNRRADMTSTSLPASLATPEASVTVGEQTAGLEPSDDPAIGGPSEAPEAEARAARAKPVRRTPRQHAKPSLEHDQAILDPWK